VLNEVALQALAALAAVLPLGAETHLRVLESPLRIEGASQERDALGRLVAALAMLVVGRRAWLHALGRARRKEAIATAFGLVIGLVGAEAWRRLSESVRPSPVAIGAGLVLTSLMLATLRVAPDDRRGAAKTRAAVIIAIVLSLSGLPGGSAVASAMVALSWSGRRASVESVLALAAPLELVAAGSVALRSRAGTFTGDVASLVAGCAASLLVAALAIRWLRSSPLAVTTLCQRWLLVLGLAELALAWALGVG
jgi:undecaprenyl pyrophosphate phosphatase UppP